MENVAHVSVLMLDIQGSTPLAKRLGGEAYLAMLPAFRDAVEQAIIKHKGGEFQKQAELGDDCIKADFSMPLDAIHCAVDIQNHFKLHSVAKDADGNDIKLVLHLAVHTCPVASDGRADRSDIPDLARLFTQANNGQILLSSACYNAYKAAHGDMPIKCEKYGGYLFKGIPGEQSIYSLLYDAEYRGAPGTQFIGFANLEAANEYIIREDAEQSVREKFVQPSGQRGGKYRFVTVFGEGGMGKTRLTINCARQLVGHFPGGVVFVPLAPFTDSAKPDAEAVANTIYLALNLEKTPGDTTEPTELLFLELKNRPATLLLLDNAESVTHEESVVAYVQRLLQNVPQLSFIASSRSYFEMDGEAQVDVNEGLTPWEAFQLFRERVRSGFVLPENATKEEIVALDARMTKGGYEIPKDTPKIGRDHELFCLLRLFWLANRNSLSLELIASWTNKYKSIDQLLTEYETDALNLLTEHAGTPSGDEITRLRHQSLEASYRWSWKNLGAEENGSDAQAAFLAAALFADAFTDEAIEAVLGWNSKSDMVRATKAVQNASLFRSSGAPLVTRYQMHWQLQAFGRDEKYWKPTNENAVFHSSLLARFTQIFRRHTKKAVHNVQDLPNPKHLRHNFIGYYGTNTEKHGYNQVAVNTKSKNWIDDEWRNIVQGARYAEMINEPQYISASLALYSSLPPYFDLIGNWKVLEEICLETVRIAKMGTDKAKLMALQGSLANVYMMQGRVDEAESIVNVLVKLGDLGSLSQQGTRLIVLGCFYAEKKCWPEVETSLKKALEIFRSLGDEHQINVVITNLGDALKQQALVAMRHGGSIQTQDKLKDALVLYFTRIVELASSPQIPALGDALGSMYLNLGDVYALNPNMVVAARTYVWMFADENYRSALQTYKDYGNLRGQAQAWLRLAELWIKQNDFRQALLYSVEGVKAARQTDDKALLQALEQQRDACIANGSAA